MHQPLQILSLLPAFLTLLHLSAFLQFYSFILVFTRMSASWSGHQQMEKRRYTRFISTRHEGAFNENRALPPAEQSIRGNLNTMHARDPPFLHRTHRSPWISALIFPVLSRNSAEAASSLDVELAAPAKYRGKKSRVTHRGRLGFSARMLSTWG